MRFRRTAIFLLALLAACGGQPKLPPLGPDAGYARLAEAIAALLKKTGAV